MKEFQRDIDILQRKTASHFGLFSSLNESFAPEELMPLLTELLNLEDNAFSYYTPPSVDFVLPKDSPLLIHFLALNLFVVEGRTMQTKVVVLLITHAKSPDMQFRKLRSQFRRIRRIAKTS